MLNTLEGLDHVVVMVQDLDAAARQWHDLGFTISPRGTHSTHIGTGNYTIMFEDNYIELLGILTPTDNNTASRAFLERRGEGIERAAFRTRDAQGGVDALAHQGIKALGPLDFNRPVSLPDGTSTEAAFSIFMWPPEIRPADLGIFACQHHTRDAVWVPSLVRQANSTTGIDRLEVIAADPAASASAMARLVDGSVQSSSDGERLATAPGHPDILFLSRSAFIRSHGLKPDAVLPVEGGAALVLRVADLKATARCVGDRARVLHDSVIVPAAEATGVTLVFQQG